MRATDKKMKKVVAFWRVAALVEDCEQRENGREYGKDRPYDGTVKYNTIVSVLANKTALFHEPLTLMGYLKTVFILFYITFIHKRRKGTHREVLCIVDDFTPAEIPFLNEELQSGI